MPYASLKLWLGRQPVAKQLGYLSFAVDGVYPSHIDLLMGEVSVFTENGQSTWTPQLPAVKNGGIWSDPAAGDGRDLLLGQASNVLEDIQLLCIGEPGRQRSVALKTLNHFALMAREFQQSAWADQPVYLELQGIGATRPQYALIYKMDVTTDQDVLYSTNKPRITLAIEREPYWRAIPPFANPKIHAFQTRNMVPSQQLSPPAGTEYNYLDMSLIAWGAADVNARHLIEATVANVNDTGNAVAANVNYVDIPASLIPGDAPCLALIGYGIDAGAARGTKMYMGRSTVPDIEEGFFAANHLRRLRNMINGGDAASIVSPVNCVTAKLSDALGGVFSNGSTVTRYVLQMVHGAPVTPQAVVATWNLDGYMYARRFHIFVRGRLTTGTPAAHWFAVRFAYAAETIETPQINLGHVTNAQYALTYLGVLDVGSLKQFSNNGYSGGGGGGGGIVMSLTVSKDPGVAAEFRLTDIILMPADEPMNIIEGAPDFRYVFNDTTGYFQPEEQTASYGNVSSKAKLTGSFPMHLIPGVRNRIYFLNDYYTGGIVNNLERYRVIVNVVPRWAGVRVE